MKNIVISTLLIICFAACKKDKNSNSNNNSGGGNTTTAYVKFKADGVQYEYNYGYSFLDNEVEQLGFSFNNGSSTDLASMILIFDKAEQLGLKTYNVVDNSFNSLWFKKSSTDKDNNEYFTFVNGGSKGNATVTVTKMKLMPNSTNVYAINGTFEGKLYNKNGGSVQITEGEFFNPLTN